MSSTQPVPETRLLSEVELSPDHAWRALRRWEPAGEADTPAGSVRALR